jgi:hypothetical protein
MPSSHKVCLSRRASQEGIEFSASQRQTWNGLLCLLAGAIVVSAVSRLWLVGSTARRVPMPLPNGSVWSRMVVPNGITNHEFALSTSTNSDAASQRPKQRRVDVDAALVSRRRPWRLAWFLPRLSSGIEANPKPLMLTDGPSHP